MALLELANVSKRFGEVLVAEDLSLSVDAGEAVGIVGPNGAGKSTLFAMISGDLAPNSGRIIFAGRDLTRLDAGARCRLGIGRTYQIPRPFEDMSVFENLLVAVHQGAGLRGRAAYRLAADVLDRTGLSGEANRPAGQLGLLARRRLEVARALSTQPRLLLLDEVAAGLTEREVDEVLTLVRSASSEGIAVVWIEHMVRALLAGVDRLVCLASGEVLADDLPDRVMSDASVREVFLGRVVPAAATVATTSTTLG